MVWGFKVSLLTDSTAVKSIANRGAARSELMQMVHTLLLDAPEFQSLAVEQQVEHEGAVQLAFGSCTGLGT
jgi:hypothetical protein